MNQKSAGKYPVIILILIIISISSTFSQRPIDIAYASRYYHTVGVDSIKKIHSDKNDALYNNTLDYAYLDSIKPVISEIIITGNNTTQDDVILREMRLCKGDTFSSKQCKEDQLKIYNLGLFASVDIDPVLIPDKKVQLNVNVYEKWYIFPMPEVSFYDGDLRKVSVGANVRWQNFRGRNENANFSFGLGYNPFVRASYSIPWIGKNLHFFSSISGSYSRDRNTSLIAIGRQNGEHILYNRDNNFDYINYSTNLTVGKYFSRNFSVYTQTGYTFLRVTQDSTGRTISPDGIDKYFLLGFGINYDSRNTRDYSSKGYFVHFDYTHYGLIDEDPVNFGRFNFEQKIFYPVDLTSDYSITVASKLFTSVAMGPVIPIYNHRFLGYGGDFVRGWAWYGYEAENELTFFNELRIPIIQPDGFKGEQIPIVRKLPYLKKFYYRYGLYMTVFYDMGGLWNGAVRFRNVFFQQGTGIGLNALLPFNTVGKVEWAFRVERPHIGQLIFGLGTKF